jgi:histidinol-phosphate/aromatic aminotransferase/cobyric acid decarboxylase-like protein
MPRFSRRSFLHSTLGFSAAATAVAAFGKFSEPVLAAAVRRRPHGDDAVLIDSNENPLGPSEAAREAMAAILPKGGRYADELTDELARTFAQIEGLNPDYVHPTVGSTPPLMHSVLAFTSPQKELRCCRSGVRSWHDGRRNERRARGQSSAHQDLCS